MITHTSLRGYKNLTCSLVALALILAISLSVEAQILTSPPAFLNSGASDSLFDTSPQVTTDGAGNWVALWISAEYLSVTDTDTDVFVVRSTNNGATWTMPAPLNTNASSDSEDEFHPQVTTDNVGKWVALWDSRENLGGIAGTDRDIFVATSTDNGVTWTPPALLNTNGASDSGNDSDPQLTTDGAGNWVAVWRSREDLGGTAGMDADIFVSTSIDNGSTWTAPSLLNTNGTSDSGVDDEPQVTTDGAGNWVAVWHSSENLVGTAGTDEDIFVSRSTDNGMTWTAPVLLNTNGASDSGVDERAQVTTDGAGNWVAVWNSDEDLGGIAGTDSDIFTATSTDNGFTWTAPSLLNTNAASDSGDDEYPQLTTDGTGNWVAVWNSDEDLGGAGTELDIFVTTSADSGATWSAPTLFHTNATSDIGIDGIPQVTTDGTGNWIAVWVSDENLAGTMNFSDLDIFVATFIVGSGLPAASTYVLAALVIALALVGAWMVLRKTGSGEN